ncbi:MAG TPA: ABC transporter substrate-binding protein [Candidatus Binatia bacterium]|jgi:ABC-type uncharacterized transport system substrate-binding protein
MWPAIKRLALGAILIALASAVLLLSDSSRRRVDPQQKTVRVAILQHASQPLLDDGVAGMIDGLAEGGYDEGRNLVLQRYNAEGDLPTANTIAKEMTGGRFDLLMTASTLSLQVVAGANAAGKVRHVFALVSDPVAAGVGISRDNPLQHPPYMAGFGTMQPVDATLRLARRIYPDLKTVGEVWNPAEANSEAQTKVARATCKDLGIELLEANAENSSAVVEAAASLIARGAQALWVGGDVTVMAALDSIIPLAKKSGIPVFSSMPGAQGRGTLFDLGADYREVGHLAGKLAAQVLSGRDPATVPVENVLPERLVIDQSLVATLKDPWRFPGDVVAQAAAEQAKAASTARIATASKGPIPGRKYKVGVVYFAPEPGVEACMRGVYDGLRDHGFVKGQNLEVQEAHAQGEIANIPALFQNFDSQGMDLVIPMSTPCVTAACGTVKKSPVVFTYCYDPIAAGAGRSFEDHNPNVTGVGSFPPVKDTPEFIQKLLPGAKKVGTVYNSSEANSRKVIEVARDVFASHGMALVEATAINSTEIFQATQSLVARGVDVLWIAGDNTAIQGFDAIVKVAADAKIPLVTSDVEPHAEKSLATLGMTFYEPGYAAGELAARVLTGEHTKDIPFQNISIVSVTLNTAIAKRLGVRIPDDVLKSAAAIVDEQGVHEQAAAAKAPAPTTPTSSKPGVTVPGARLAKTWKLDLLELVTVLDVEEGEHGIKDGLREAGLVEGRDYVLRIRNAQGDIPTLSALVDASLTDGSDLMLTMSTPTLQAAMQRAKKIPIVFTFVANAVAAGAAKSNEDHAPNVTGVPTMGAYDELLKVVRDCVPNVKRIGTLFVPAEVNSVYNKDELTKLAGKQGIEVVAVPANTATEIADAALALTNQPLDAVVQIAGNLTASAFVSITQASRRARLPLFGTLGSNAVDGAQVTVARDYYEGGREAALMAARIMRGESPANIPLEPLRQVRLLVNEDAARAIGMRIPDSVLGRAEKVAGSKKGS